MSHLVLWAHRHVLIVTRASPALCPPFVLLHPQRVGVIFGKVLVKRRVNTHEPILNFHAFYLFPDSFHLSVVFKLNHVILNFEGLNLLLLLMIYLIFFHLKLIHILVVHLLRILILSKRLVDHDLIDIVMVLLLIKVISDFLCLLLNRYMPLICIGCCSVGGHVSWQESCLQGCLGFLVYSHLPIFELMLNAHVCSVSQRWNWLASIFGQLNAGEVHGLGAGKFVSKFECLCHRTLWFLKSYSCEVFYRLVCVIFQSCKWLRISPHRRDPSWESLSLGPILFDLAQLSFQRRLSCILVLGIETLELIRLHPSSLQLSLVFESSEPIVKDLGSVLNHGVGLVLGSYRYSEKGISILKSKIMTSIFFKLTMWWEAFI